MVVYEKGGGAGYVLSPPLIVEYLASSDPWLIHMMKKGTKEVLHLFAGQRHRAATVHRYCGFPELLGLVRLW